MLILIVKGLLSLEEHSYLNTSHVNLNQFEELKTNAINKDLNTSHVNLNHLSFTLNYIDFNI
ncbi:hypothetical protein CNEO_910033 [Clostridium neonatale]|nr:hypothetical protein CNEO_910033 [Clostridium neonatale]